MGAASQLDRLAVRRVAIRVGPRVLSLEELPLLVGAIHGLAGSGALTALVLATLPSTASRLAYVALFGVGSTLSMAAMSGLFGWPLARLGMHHVVARGVIGFPPSTQTPVSCCHLS